MGFKVHNSRTFKLVPLSAHDVYTSESVMFVLYEHLAISSYLDATNRSITKATSRCRELAAKYLLRSEAYGIVAETCEQSPFGMESLAKSHFKCQRRHSTHQPIRKSMRRLSEHVPTRRLYGLVVFLMPACNGLFMWWQPRSELSCAAVTRRNPNMQMDAEQWY